MYDFPQGVDKDFKFGGPESRRLYVRNCEHVLPMLEQSLNSIINNCKHVWSFGTKRKVNWTSNNVDVRPILK